MNKNRHTPGPWEVDDANPEMVFTTYGADDSGMRQYICDCEGTGSYETTPQSEYEANARLIAAAPELLEACKEALEQIQHDNEELAGLKAYAAEMGVGEWEAFMPSAWHKLQAVIAKAQLTNEKGKNHDRQNKRTDCNPQSRHACR